MCNDQIPVALTRKCSLSHSPSNRNRQNLSPHAKLLKYGALSGQKGIHLIKHIKQSERGTLPSPTTLQDLSTKSVVASCLEISCDGVISCLHIVILTPESVLGVPPYNISVPGPSGRPLLFWSSDFCTVLFLECGNIIEQCRLGLHQQWDRFSPCFHPPCALR